MKYEPYAILLLSHFESYLPYMTEEEIVDMLEYGVPPGPWRIRAMERERVARKDTLDNAINNAISRQK